MPLSSSATLQKGIIHLASEERHRLIPSSSQLLFSLPSLATGNLIKRTPNLERSSWSLASFDLPSCSKAEAPVISPDWVGLAWAFSWFSPSPQEGFADQISPWLVLKMCKYKTVYNCLSWRQKTIWIVFLCECDTDDREEWVAKDAEGDYRQKREGHKFRY